MITLSLARAFYLVSGVAGLLLTFGNVTGAMSGSIVQWELVVGGIGAGLLAIGAALWVQARDRVRAVVAWLGILALGAVFLWPLTWNLGSTRDVLLYSVLPTAVGLLAAARMAWTRARTPLGADPDEAAPTVTADPA